MSGVLLYELLNKQTKQVSASGSQPKQVQLREEHSLALERNSFANSKGWSAIGIDTLVCFDGEGSMSSIRSRQPQTITIPRQQKMFEDARRQISQMARKREQLETKWINKTNLDEIKITKIQTESMNMQSEKEERFVRQLRLNILESRANAFLKRIKRYCVRRFLRYCSVSFEMCSMHLRRINKLKKECFQSWVNFVKRSQKEYALEQAIRLRVKKRLQI